MADESASLPSVTHTTGDRDESKLALDNPLPEIWAGDDLVVVDSTSFILRNHAEEYQAEDSTEPRFVLVKEPSIINRLAAMIEALRPERIVELGIFKGGGTALLALLAQPRKLTAIELEREPVEALGDFIDTRRLGDVVSLHYGVDQADTEALASLLAHDHGEAPLDLVIDDASHLYQASRASFEAIFPRLRPGGMYVIEDWNWAHRPDSLWQEAGGWFHDRPALTNLVLELLMVAGTSADLISKVVVFYDSVEVTRGPLPLSKTIHLEEHYHNRGQQLRPLL